MAAAATATTQVTRWGYAENLPVALAECMSLLELKTLVQIVFTQELTTGNRWNLQLMGNLMPPKQVICLLLAVHVCSNFGMAQ